MDTIYKIITSLLAVFISVGLAHLLDNQRERKRDRKELLDRSTKIRFVLSEINQHTLTLKKAIHQMGPPRNQMQPPAQNALRNLFDTFHVFVPEDQLLKDINIIANERTPEESIIDRVLEETERFRKGSREEIAKRFPNV